MATAKRYLTYCDLAYITVFGCVVLYGSHRYFCGDRVGMKFDRMGVDHELVHL